MNLLKYEGAESFLKETGFTPAEGLLVVENELIKLQKNKKIS